MSRYHQKIIKVLIVLLVLLGAWWWYQKSHDQVISSQADYIEVVRPWFKEINPDYSLEQIVSVRNKLFNLNSKDKLVGDSHINLFLAFDSWQQYLESNNLQMQAQANTFFEQATVAMPPLHNDIKRLQKILLGDV